MSVPMTIRFLPQLREDIKSYIPLLAETGLVKLELICSVEKTIVEVEENTIDFEEVIFGEQKMKTLKFVNKGALKSSVCFKSLTGNFLEKIETSSKTSSVYQRQQSDVSEENDQNEYDDDLSQFVFQKSFEIEGYSSFTLPIKFIPQEIGLFNVVLEVYVEEFQFCKPFNISIKGKSVEVPIYIEKPIYDLRVCSLNQIYREKLVFYNRGKNSMKIQMKSPKVSKQFFEFNPTLGYIQGNDKFEIWVKFIFNEEFLKICSKYISGQFMKIPFQLMASDQVMPVTFDISAILTTDTLNFVPKILDFDTIFQGTAKKLDLTLENTSLLPQEILVYPIPKNMEIFPKQIPYIVLPKEQLTLEVVYFGTMVQEEEENLYFKIITGQVACKVQKLVYMAKTINMKLQFSYKKLVFPTLQEGESDVRQILITNQNEEDYIVEFQVPYYEICGIEIFTAIKKVPKKSQTFLNIQYNSLFRNLDPFTLKDLEEKYENDPVLNFQKKQEDQRKIQKQLSIPAEQAKDKGKIQKKSQKEIEEEKRMEEEKEKERLQQEEENKKKIKENFDEKKQLQKYGGKLKEFFNEEQNERTQIYTWLIPVYIKPLNKGEDHIQKFIFEVTTNTIERQLVFDRKVVDFGALSVGERKVEEIIVTNNSQTTIKLSHDILSYSNGFSLLNALREILPQQSKTIILEFKPNAEKFFKEKFQLKSDSLSASIMLEGQGVQPNISIKPENGLINMGNILMNEISNNEIQIVNESCFQIAFNIVTLRKGIQNYSSTKPFEIIPSQGFILPNSTSTVKINFRPERVSQQFYELLLIDVPMQKSPRNFYVFGNCYDRQAFVQIYKPITVCPSEKEISVCPEYNLEYQKITDLQKVYSEENKNILLMFPKCENFQKQQELKINIGACKLLDSKVEKPVNFEITMPVEMLIRKMKMNNYSNATIQKVLQIQQLPKLQLLLSSLRKKMNLQQISLKGKYQGYTRYRIMGRIQTNSKIIRRICSTWKS